MHDRQTLLDCAAPAALDPEEIETLLAPLPIARRPPSSVTHRLRIELARGRFSPESVTAWRAGSMVPFEPRPGSAVDIYLNERLAAVGELFVDAGTWRVRIVELVTDSSSGVSPARSLVRESR